MNSNFKSSNKVIELGNLPVEWEVREINYYLDRVIDYRGKTPKKSSTGIPVLSAKSVKRGRIDYNQVYFISQDTYKKWETRGKPEIGDVLLTTEGPLGEVAQLDKANVAVAQRLLILRGKSGQLDNTYLMYYLMSPIGQYQLNSRSTGTTVQGIKQSEFRKILIVKPSFKEQLIISNILKSLDSKIKLNQKMNKTLEAIAQAIFKHWFIDFEFPNEEGKPYKSSGGEMVDSELGKIPKGWKIGKLKDVALNLDSKRIPLSSREREKRRGVFPYYGAASVLDYVDAYIFDGIYLLIGEDGTVTDEQGHPILQYVSGKFWVNNHAHVIQGKFPFSTEYLYLFLRQRTVRHLVTGAVQAKINQENLNGIPLVIPPEDILYAFNKFSEILFSRNRLVINQIDTLSLLLKTLLPKLISGKIRVPLEE